MKTSETTASRSAAACPSPGNQAGVSFADAPALPFVPFDHMPEPAVPGLVVNRTARENRRRIHRRPRLALAALCMICSAGALFTSSPTGRASIGTAAHKFELGVHDARMNALGSLGKWRGLEQARILVSGFR